MEAVTLLNQCIPSWAPPPPLTCAQWADTYRQVASTASSDPGQWRTSRTPYLKEIMECVTDAAVERIVIMKATRMGATECINNAIGYHIHYDPCPILYVQTSLEEGRKYSSEIFSMMVSATPALRERLGARERGRKATITKLHKNFPGGNLTIVGAASPKGFRMSFKRFVICDDIDGYESTKEGDPVKLAIGRADTVWNKKIILASSPTVKGYSAIEDFYGKSDMRSYHVPCPHCDEFQVLDFGGKDLDYGIKWPREDTASAYYLCRGCRKKIEHYSKSAMVSRGQWRPAEAFNGVAGFQISKLYSPYVPWSAVVNDFLESKDTPTKLQVFINQALGVPFEQKGEVINEGGLSIRREDYGEFIPEGVCVLTIGVDVQDDRIEAECVGWGRGEESWGIAYKVFYGAPSEAAVWALLDIFLKQTYKKADGAAIAASCVCIDSGGHYTRAVYEFARERIARQVYAVKGSNMSGSPLVGKPSSNNIGKVKLYIVGTNTAKDCIYGAMKITELGAGYMHFPSGYEDGYFRQLTSEFAYTDVKSKKRVWKLRAGRRNEALDCRVYAYAALGILAPDWDAFAAVDSGAGLSTHRVYIPARIETKPFDINKPIIVCCGDFTRRPLIWELIQDHAGQVHVFDELTSLSGDVTALTREVLKRYMSLTKSIFLVYGPAFGGKSNYAIMHGVGLRNHRTRAIDPKTTDRVNALNFKIADGSLTVNVKCIQLCKDLEQTVWLDNGTEVDLARGRGGAGDAVSYYIASVYPLRSSRLNAAKTFWK